MLNSSDDIILTETQIEFIKYRFRTEDPDIAVERLIELLVLEGTNPMNMGVYVDKMIQKFQN